MSLLRVGPELLLETAVVDSFGVIGVLVESDGLSVESQRLRNRFMLEWHSPWTRDSRETERQVADGRDRDGDTIAHKRTERSRQMTR